MAIYGPPHPGEFIRELYIEPTGLSIRKVAEALGVSPSTLNRLLNGRSAISSEMALRLSITLGRSPESWLAMQDQLICGRSGKKSIWMRLEKLMYRRLKRD